MILISCYLDCQILCNLKCFVIIMRSNIHTVFFEIINSECMTDFLKFENEKIVRNSIRNDARSAKKNVSIFFLFWKS